MTTHTWTWPLPGSPFDPAVLTPDHAGSFAHKRRLDVHTGIDLYCNQNQLVIACEGGTVVAIDNFTGLSADSPWWEETKFIMIEGISGVILYGEVKPLDGIVVGSVVTAGMPIAHIVRVLKVDKGKPMDMLHLELYQHGTTDCVWWYLGAPQPTPLRDPSSFLRFFNT